MSLLPILFDISLIVRELPKRDLTVEEAPNEALEVVEEMQVMLGGVRELSDAFEV